MIAKHIMHQLDDEYFNDFVETGHLGDLKHFVLRELLNLKKDLDGAMSHLDPYKIAKHWTNGWYSMGCIERLKSGIDFKVIREHPVPVDVVINKLIDLKSNGHLTLEAATEIISKYVHICVVTRDEDKMLRDAHLNNRMPADWDGENIWARYEAVGIKWQKGSSLK